MSKKDVLLETAQRMFVVEQMTIEEIAVKLEVNEKTIRRWKQRYDWDYKKNNYINSKTMFHEELYNFARKLMTSIESDIDSNERVDPGRMFAFTKMLPLITKIKEYEESVSKKQKDSENKGITPDFIKLIETEILGKLIIFYPIKSVGLTINLK